MARLAPFALCTLTVLSLAGAAAAQSYWANQDGAVLHYGTALLSVSADGDDVCYMMETTPGYGTSDCYHIAEDGDVLFTGSYYASAGFVESSRYEPPLLLLDLPLTTGRSWSAAATWNGPDYGVVGVEVDGLVLGPASTAVPGLGDDVPVIAVRLAFTYTPLDSQFWPEDRIETWLLHPQLGRVEGLVSWEGIVPARGGTWGGLKARYR